MPVKAVTPYDIPTRRDGPHTALEVRDALRALNSVNVTIEQIEAAAEAYQKAANESFDPDSPAAWDGAAARRRGMQAMVDCAASEGFEDPALAADALDYRHAIIIDCYANGAENPRDEVPDIYYGAATRLLDPGAFGIWPEHPLWRELRLMGLCEAQIACLGDNYNGDGVPPGYAYRNAGRP